MINFLFIILFFLFQSLIISSASLAYPADEGDCNEAHGITLVDAINDPEIQITVDGNNNDSGWVKYESLKYEIPLATDTRDTAFYVVYMNISFLIIGQNLYVYCEWKDTTTRRGEGNIYDGVYFCWNIDVPDFSADFSSGMNTKNMGGGTVDSWSWYFGEYIEESGIAYDGLDMAFHENGWYSKSVEKQDLIVAYTFKEGESYSVEMKRVLVTNDQYDVQFDHTGTYEFNMAIINDGCHQDHAISWTYALNIEELPLKIPGFALEILFLVGIVTIVFISLCIIIPIDQNKTR